MLAITLARDLAREALKTLSVASGDQGPTGWARVPVRLSASGFDPTGGTGTNPGPERVARHFDEWVINQLCNAHGLGERDAVSLTSAGWITPIIDGVDEMDAQGQEPSRATAMMAALNRQVGFTPTGLRPVVVTCRSDRYQELTDTVPGRSVGYSALGFNGLEDATVVQVEPLTDVAVRRHLLHRFPDPSGSIEGQPRWRPVLDVLRSSETAGEEWRRSRQGRHSPGRSPEVTIATLLGYRRIPGSVN